MISNSFCVTNPLMDRPSPFDRAMELALNAAKQFAGNTAPNPPVGAILLDKKGKVLCGAGHEKAGLPHAEAKAISVAEKMGLLSEVHTLVVTLEPCNHTGRTPPCVDAILKSKIKQVVVGARDPNAKVAGGGIERLKKAGIEVIEGVRKKECRELIRAFTKWSTTGLPWVTVKQAFTHDGSMIPPAGEKTFTSEDSLRFAHELRKRADAIWTGSGTVLADRPEFTVRHVKDFPGKRRILVLSDRRKQIPADWKKARESQGFSLWNVEDLLSGLKGLGERGVLEVLVEAGPKLSNAFLESGLWDEHVVIKQGDGESDEIEIIEKGEVN